ncbi:hypothetical protein RhiJN_21386 [Ceratobasidium sp. AG-Ba]|nr:hypothetical protein RhiJN_21386 [Ceratobasidium sp. AG-Ba]
MRFAFFALLTAASALAQPVAEGLLKLNPDTPLPGFTFGTPAAAPATPLTNGKRFEQGLPPLKPRVRRHRGGPHKGYLPGTPVRSAPRAETSPIPPTTTNCVILATYTNGTQYGYVVPKFNAFGEYYQFQPTPDGALSVSFPFSPDSPSELSLTVTNYKDTETWPFFGGIAGYASSNDNFGRESYNYAYLGGTTSTEAGSPAKQGPNSFTAASGINKDIETAIWSYDPATTNLTPQWINQDGTAPATTVAYVQGVLTITGDTNALATTFGSVTPLNLKCVSPATINPA